MAEDRMLSDEILLGLIKANGGGGGGTSDYSQLSNKPQINSVELSGNKSLSDLGIASATALGNVSDAVTAIKDGQTIDSFADVETALAGKQGTLTFDNAPTENSNNPVKSGGVYSALAGKQGTLTAGDYIGISSGTIKVNLEKGQPDVYEYRIYNGEISDQVCIMNVDLYINGSLEEQHSYTNQQLMGNPVTIDDRIRLAYSYPSWTYTLLERSNEHISGYSYSWVYNNTIDTRESFNVYDVATTLATKRDIDAAISSAYHHAGTKTCAELVAGLLVAANEGNVYNITDSGTTTADFIEGAGQPIKAGDNVGIAKISDRVYKFDLLSGFVDTTNFVQKSQTVGLIKNDGTIDTVAKQPVTDNNLETTAKTIVGAINEHEGDIDSLKSGLTNVDNATILNTQDLTTPSRTKNIIPLTIENAKKYNTEGTWSGNTLTYLGLDYDLQTDNNGNVIAVVVSGSTSSYPGFYAMYQNTFLPDVYKISSGGQRYRLYKNGSIEKDSWNENTFTVNSTNDKYDLLLFQGSGEITNVTYYPMIRLASVSDATFAPYVPSVESRIEAVESGLTTVNSKFGGVHFLNTSIAVAGSIDINTTALSKFMIITSNNTTGRGLYICYSDGSNNTNADPVKNASGLTLTAGSGKLIVANGITGSEREVQVTILVMVGDLTIS